jgi:Sel1 repeat
MTKAIFGMVLLLAMGAEALAHPPSCAMPPTSANERTFAEAAKVCRVSAEQGDAKSQYVLASMYQRGKGVPQDYTEALHWYRMAAEQGDASAEYGLCYMYRNGQGVQQGYAEAIRWCRKAADQGDPKAQSVLGLMYSNGFGVSQDYTEAVRWYRKAADQGYAIAQYNLGNMYYYGRGVPRDNAEALRWYRKAADQGDEYAQRALGFRGVRLSTFSKISIATSFFGSLILVMSFLLPGQSLRNPQQRVITLAGLLGLLSVGLDLYRHSPIVVLHSVFAANALALTQHLLGGTLIAMIICGFWPKSAKVMLGISGTLFVAINLLLLVIAYHDPRRLAVIRGCYSGNGFLIGISVPLAIFLFLQSGKPTEIGQAENSQR